MRETRITLPELGLVAGTRAALGAGVGRIVSVRVSTFGDRLEGAPGWDLKEHSSLGVLLEPIDGRCPWRWPLPGGSFFRRTKGSQLPTEY